MPSGTDAYTVAFAEVVDACDAPAAAHHFEMEPHVVGVALGEHAQEMAAELFPRGARQPVAAPHFAKRVQPRVAPSDERREAFAQLFVITQRRLDLRDPLGSGGLVEISVEFGVVERAVGHRLSAKRTSNKADS